MIETLSKLVPQGVHFPAEINLCGFYITPIFIAIFLGFIFAIITCWLMACIRMSSFVWHPPLFFFSLTAIYSLIFSIFFMPI